MSLITGCPACGTMFRVVPDQLKISEGWVRCGHCAQVFDATAHLQDGAVLAGATRDAAQPSSTQVEQGAIPSIRPGADVAPPEELPPAAQRPEQLDAGGSEERLPDGSASAQEAAQSSETVPVAGATTAHAEDPPDAPAAVRDDEGAAGAGYAELPLEAFRRESEADAPAPAVRDADVGDEPVEDVSFLRDARRKAFWRRPLVRAVLALSAIALLLLLALQAAVHERDRLAAAQPSLRPWLERLCQPLQCRIEAPRRIEALAIESSGFTKLRPDGYRLSFTLKNNGGQPVALPALELTLTDTQDQPVLRRVLLPRDLGAPSETVAAGADWSAAVTVAVEPPAANGRIAGYRLLAFYP
ncbi:MAG TPA: DUF3426 domain-containing protein [Ramlibacter sp.]|nr:DUF3426 domain-containing protein [Ramlibacter sp.]